MGLLNQKVDEKRRHFKHVTGSTSAELGTRSTEHRAQKAEHGDPRSTIRLLLKKFTNNKINKIN